jgi:DNA-binding transcriptional regulator YdaS (Cro superfamily)
MDRKLKARIIEQFGSQANFAQALGEDESFVSRIVCGRRTLDPKRQATWAKALKWIRWGVSSCRDGGDFAG